MGLSRILVSPDFLFRIESDPPGVEPGSIYRVSDIELATRLSYFLWSSIPDDDLLDAARRGQLKGTHWRGKSTACAYGRFSSRCAGR